MECNLSLHKHQPKEIITNVTIKLRALEGKKWKKLQDLGIGMEFLDLTPKAQSIKGKIDKLDLIKVKNFLCEISLGEFRKTSQRLVENICKPHI